MRWVGAGLQDYKYFINHMIFLYRTLGVLYDLVSLLINLVSWWILWLTCWLAFVMIGNGIVSCFLDLLAA